MINLLIGIVFALPVPRPCVFAYFYDDGIKDTYCYCVYEKNESIILDCSAGIKDNGKTFSNTQLPVVNSVSDRCLEPQNWQLKIIKELYKENLKLYKKKPISDYIRR